MAFFEKKEDTLENGGSNLPDDLKKILKRYDETEEEDLPEVPPDIKAFMDVQAEELRIFLERRILKK